MKNTLSVLKTKHEGSHTLRGSSPSTTVGGGVWLYYLEKVFKFDTENEITSVVVKFVNTLAFFRFFLFFSFSRQTVPLRLFKDFPLLSESPNTHPQCLFSLRGLSLFFLSRSFVFFRFSDLLVELSQENSCYLLVKFRQHVWYRAFT